MESRMKTVALTTVLTLAIGAYTPAPAQGPYDNHADAHKDIEAALRQARADDRLVLLDFGANWCLDCIVLSRLFEDKTVRSFLQDNFHVVQVDVGNWDRNLDVSISYVDLHHVEIETSRFLSQFPTSTCTTWKLT